MRRTVTAFILFLALILPGCCTCRDSYKEFLGGVATNLEKVGVKYGAYLKADTTEENEKFREADWKLFDDTLFSIKRVAESGIAPTGSSTEVPGE